MDSLISFYTIGCRSNQAETAILKNLFLKKGFSLSCGKKHSDIVIINTCTVTEKSDLDTRKLVLKVTRLNPQVKIALVGCQAQTQSQELSKLPNVRWIVGNNEKMNIVDIIHRSKNKEKPLIINSPITAKNFKITALSDEPARTRANIKIQEGCDCFCTFCEVPYARGSARSRVFEDVIKDAKYLAKKGYQEIILTGTNIGLYKDGNRKLIDLVEGLDSIKGINRIRISSIEPGPACRDLVLRMGSKSKLCRHLHLSLQSGSSDILKRMGRSYKINEIQELLDFTIKRVPEICLGADIIVGFPGETIKFFEETFSFLKNAPLAYLHVFSYSNRKFAKSKNFKKQVPRNIIAQRSSLLRKLSICKKRIFLENFPGTRQEVLFEEFREKIWKGLTDHYLRVKVISNKNLHNKIKFVKIMGIQDDSLLGKLILKGGFYARNSNESQYSKSSKK